MGLPAHRNWVLLANWFDATLGMRTAFAFELGARLGVPYTPSFHFVELYMNGRYDGLYLLTEHRQVCPLGVGAPGRPQVFYENRGWMVEFDFRWHDEDEDPKFRTRNFNLPLVIKGAPNSVSIDGHTYTFREGHDYTNQDTRNFVVSQWNELTDLMAASTFPDNGYRELIDMDAIIKYFMVQVIANNVDFFLPHNPNDWRSHPGSVFWHRRDGDSRIAAGPLWDFDLSFGSFIATTLNTNSSSFYRNNPALRLLGPEQRPWPNYPFFARFLQDPVFLARWVELWFENRDIIGSMVYWIDETATRIRPYAIRNYARWRVRQDHGNNVDFDWWVQQMRDYTVTRLAFLDNVYSQYISGVKETTLCNLAIFPSVFANVVNVVSAGKGATVQVFDITGTLVHTENIYFINHHPLQLGHLPAGVYFFRFEQNGNTRTMRAIKQ